MDLQNDKIRNRNMINAYVPNRTVSTDLFEKRLKDADLSPMVTKCKTINERE